MLTDPAGGLEAGDNAVMIEGFSSAPMMTNQQPLSFGTDGKLNYDPINFELPNLAYGAYTSSNADRSCWCNGRFNHDRRVNVDRIWLRLLTLMRIANDWAAFDTADVLA